MIKHQPQSKKRPYESPTTPGLYIDFRNYIIELVCLNTNPKIGPRFWSSSDYWRKKYSRETRGVKQLSEILDFDSPPVRTAMIEVVSERCIKALVRKDIINLIIKQTKIRLKYMIEQRQAMAENAQIPQQDNDYQQRNSRFIDTGTKGAFAKIRDIENGEKKTEKS